MNGRVLRVVPIAALLLGLLALVALASRAAHRRTDLPSVPGPPSQVLDYGLTAALTLAAVALLYGLSRLRAPRPRQVRSKWEFLRSILLTASIIAISLLIGRQLHFAHHHVAAAGGAGGGKGQHLTPAKGAAHDRSIAFQWPAAAAVFGAAAICLVAYLLIRRRQTGALVHPDEEPSALALSEAFDESLDDLRSEPDPRRAVIAAYARAERALDRHGLPRRPAEAPLEYLARVLLELRVRASAVLELTDLFERAKFSPHRVDEAMRSDAITALATVRDDLAGAAA